MAPPGAARNSLLEMPPKKQTASLMVAVRVRPRSKIEKARAKDETAGNIVRVVDGKVVIVMDPDASKAYLDVVQNRSKEKRYVFDTAFDVTDTNQRIFEVVCADLVSGVLRGLNATVFAYGATGSGKTYTMVGTQRDPGLMVRSLEAVFAHITRESNGSEDFEVSCSYLEVYNEIIYDLLVPNSGSLELREDPDQGILVSGLRRVQVSDANAIMALLSAGNGRRKTEATNANATSSRSHAVLEVVVRRTERNRYVGKVMRGKLAMVDLAGSERAAETNNAGQKLRDGANINRSLLALANCINALGKSASKKGIAYVPYRNSKLTRILKDGLSGNSRTAMVATVSCGFEQYAHTVNTLKYADRAKEIKTHVMSNVGTVASHVSEYQRMIDELQSEVSVLREQLAEKSVPRPVDASDDALSWLHDLSTEISANVEERINLQKALYELEDANVLNRCELQSIDDASASGEDADVEQLAEHRASVLESIRANEQSGLRIRADIEHNEEQRKSLQEKIDSAMQERRGTAFLKILSQYRLMSVTNQELRFQIAVRDEIVSDQRDVVSNIWRILESTGMSRDEIIAIAKKEGILVGDPSNPDVGGGGGGGAALAKSDLKLLHQKSLTGARAKYRYDFWQSYDGGSLDDLDAIEETPRPTPDKRTRAASARVNASQSSDSEVLSAENASLKLEVERLKAKLGQEGSPMTAGVRRSHKPPLESHGVTRSVIKTANSQPRVDVHASADSSFTSIKQKAIGLLKGRGQRKSIHGSANGGSQPPKA